MLNSVPRREREVLDALYAIGEGRASDVQAVLDDPPSHSAVRTMLVRLEQKGLVRHRLDRNRYIYSPVPDEAQASAFALRKLVHTFFKGSPARAATALLGMTGPLEDGELAALEEAVKRARSQSR